MTPPESELIAHYRGTVEKTSGFVLEDVEYGYRATGTTPRPSSIVR
jgi:hypothetical protein